jgi:hypothetical protein
LEEIRKLAAGEDMPQLGEPGGEVPVDQPPVEQGEPGRIPELDDNQPREN